MSDKQPATILDSGPSSTTGREGSMEPIKSIPPIKHLPLRKRLTKEIKLVTPKPESPKANVVEEYPPTPGAHSSGGSSESTILIVHSPPPPPPSVVPPIKTNEKEDTSSGEDNYISSEEEKPEVKQEVKKPTPTAATAAATFLLKKQPLKKAYNNLVSAAVVASKGKSTLPPPLPPMKNKGLAGNPLLFAKSEQYAPEDTIDSFKSAWLGSEDDDDEEEEEIEQQNAVEQQQHKTYLIKKSNSSSATVNKRGRPPVAKRSFSNDASFSNIKKEQQQQHQEEQPLPPTKVRRTSTTNRSTMDGKLYCVCRQPYDATRFMIACDRCDDWFHGECIGISEKESEFVDLYFCTKCSKITGKKTSWKPKCANPACHKAARIGSHLGHLSKYCLDSCGMQVARARLELVEIKRRQLASPSNANLVPIAQLAFLKQKQARIHSFADKRDKKRLLQIRQEKKVIRDHVQAIDRKIKLFHDIVKDSSTMTVDPEMEEEDNEEGPCGFDSRLILQDDYSMKKDKMEVDHTVCQESNCAKHTQWKKIISSTFNQEREEQFKLLASIEKERRQIKSRMTKRRSEKEMMKDLVNGTIEA